jgi:hypothetical protein
LTAWAKELDREGLIRLETFHGKSGVLTLLPRLRAYGVGLVTIYNARSPNGAYLQFNRTVIEKRAPATLERIEQLAAPARVGQGTVTRAVSEALLAALTDGYREAASSRVNVESGSHDDDGTFGAVSPSESD